LYLKDGQIDKEKGTQTFTYINERFVYSAVLDVATNSLTIILHEIRDGFEGVQATQGIELFAADFYLGNEYLTDESLYRYCDWHKTDVRAGMLTDNWYQYDSSLGGYKVVDGGSGVGFPYVTIASTYQKGSDPEAPVVAIASSAFLNSQMVRYAC